MKKYAFVCFLWLFAIIAGGFVLYQDIFVNGKSVHLTATLFLIAVAVSFLAIVYFLLKKGQPITVIKLAVLALSAALLLIISILE